jgi:hypothetical protein
LTRESELEYHALKMEGSLYPTYFHEKYWYLRQNDCSETSMICIFLVTHTAKRLMEPDAGLVAS